MYEVRDGARTLRFEGQLLANSTSRRNDSTRWIEFALYKTDSGTYILSRIGASVVFHNSVCTLVSKYGLHEIESEKLNRSAVPCEICRPTRREPLIYPEQYRFWTMTTRDPTAVLDALYKYDDNGSKYLTKVAERLLDNASDEDAAIDSAYRIEFID